MLVDDLVGCQATVWKRVSEQLQICVIGFLRYELILVLDETECSHQNAVHSLCVTQWEALLFPTNLLARDRG